MTKSYAKNHTARHFIASLSLLILSVCFFFLSHPNFLFTNGIPFLAWIAYIPLFILADTLSLKASIMCGFIYGISCYLLYCSWLVAFSSVGMAAACLLYGPLLA